MLPNDVLELGQYLVRELGLDTGVDTLGKWMAHHLAQLMDMVNHATTENERLIAQQRSIEIILKIWEHRAMLPGRIYPLHTLKEVIPVLKRLQPTNNPFSYFENSPEAKREHLAANLFDSLTRLIMTLLFMRLPHIEQEVPHEQTPILMLNDIEKYVISTIESWADFIIPHEDNIDSSSNNETSEEFSNVYLNQIAIDHISRIETTLSALKAHIQGKSDEEESPGLKIYGSERPEYSDIEDWEEN
ncbi:hypothetical protein [Herpetosiphon gulosus]|uniref:Uncharacterized protein n=2 Tax=Herpetosiphon TaxID=64 RepID=A0ABP9X7Q1_9CHLR